MAHFSAPTNCVGSVFGNALRFNSIGLFARHVGLFEENAANNSSNWSARVMPLFLETMKHMSRAEKRRMTEGQSILGLWEPYFPVFSRADLIAFVSFTTDPRPQ